MKVTELSAKEYAELFPNPSHVFNFAAFVELNSRKCERIHRLAFSDGRVYAGIVFGECNGELMSPFSAPFGGFDVNREPTVGRMVDIAEALTDWLGGRRCIITLPPLFYSPALTARSAYAMQSIMARQKSLINHHLEVTDSRVYLSTIDSKARNKLKTGMKSDWKFCKLDSANPDDIERAYRIIAVNRANRGYILRMSLEDVVNTTPVVRAEFFILSINGLDIASAQVYPTAPGIVQVIYWGDTGECQGLHPMNLLAACMLDYYSRTDVKVIDIGPSGDFEGVNNGLADFKESIGCVPSLKFRYIIN